MDFRGALHSWCLTHSLSCGSDSTLAVPWTTGPPISPPTELVVGCRDQWEDPSGMQEGKKEGKWTSFGGGDRFREGIQNRTVEAGEAVSGQSL